MFSLIGAIFLRIISNPLGNVVQKQLSQEKLSSLCINFTTYTFLTAATLAFLPDFINNHHSSTFWHFAVIGGLFGATGNACLIKAVQQGELSVLGPINSYKSVVGIILGFFLLKEAPNLYGILGITLIIFGSYFVFDTVEEKFSFKLLKRKDIIFRILALIFTATEAIFIKKVILESSVLDSFIVWCWFGALFSLAIFILGGIQKFQRECLLRQNYIPKFLLLAICMGMMQYTTNYVFNKMNVGYALALFQLSTIVSIFFGYKFFQEKQIRKKLIGAIIMILGSVIIILN